MNLELVIFYVFAALLVFAGLRVITARNPVHAALFLVLAFFTAAEIWLLLKIFFVVSMFLWFRATFPRYRYDQIMRLGWKVFIPLTIVWLVLIAAWMQTPWNPWA